MSTKMRVFELYTYILSHHVMKSFEHFYDSVQSRVEMPKPAAGGLKAPLAICFICSSVNFESQEIAQGVELHSNENFANHM